MSDKPQFTNRDPGDPAFWDERFEQAFTPWDAGGVPQAVRDFVGAEPAPLSTLIPGCGAAHEVGWLAELGWPVSAIDFSASAVAAARAGLGRHGAHVQQADFFTFEPAKPVYWVYERAFLCALPPHLRAAYARRVGELLPTGGRLAGFFFLGDTPGGPPFGMDRATLLALLSPAFSLVQEAPVDDSLPVFAGRERWMVWQRR
ncbi:thiopurine s-methyltransferase [Pandoraea thiooxydans]|uniref:SAM-dependent methyltransferase n=1 Tax=Pandoraea thiooxydans TaxID=445709 RepID=A0A0G3EQ88_9BURK|nr:hypothetical protein [Pandoraea thiooxydans]AKJ69130.1 hypothetical protein ABW99_13850 [Pandoraea thiooxydans]APR96706.1 thiopurine s-methyltransferase [Pandoraea thiooxydans]